MTAETPYPVIDPAAPCGWCDSTDRPRIQRGPSPLGYQCADADACNTDHRAEMADRFPPKDMTPWVSGRAA